MPDAKPTQAMGQFDYVIVGAGSAGCVLANRLSADAKKRVLLLEAGGKDDYVWIHIPVGYLYCMGNPRTDWGYKTEPAPGLNGRSLNYPRGRVLGGCSSINGMIYMRGQAADYDQWRQMGNVGWGWDDVLPYFLRSEDYQEGADGLHASGGEWRVEQQRLRWDILDAYREAAVQAGVPRTEDFNRGDNEGAAYFRVNQRGGWRWSAARGFLNPAKGRPNLTVMTKAEVDHLTIEDGRATGAVFAQGGQLRLAEGGEIVLCAGAIGSPAILERSGVGQGDRLRALGIAVRRDAPGVGENLQDHLQIRVAFAVEGVETLNTRAASLWGKAKIALEYALFRSGPMSMAPSQLGIFAKSDPAVATADLEFHVQPLSLTKFGEPLDPYPAFTASVVPLRPGSRGGVHVKTAHRTDAPAIAPNYLSTEGDRLTAARAIRLARRIAGQDAMARYRPREIRPGAEIEDDGALAAAAGDIGTTIFHPVGTAKMGDDPMAVVDSRLRVHGVGRLRVVDASVMPTITSGNTNSPVVMIAEKAADMMIEDAKAAG